MQRNLTINESEQQVERSVIDPEQTNHVKCQVHGKPCVMFCLKQECWKTLCPKCPVQEHQEHNLVGIFECIKDPEELQKMKRDVKEVEKLLKAYTSRLEVNKAAVLQNAKEVGEKIRKIAKVMKKQINAKARELTKKVQRNSDKQVSELEVVRQTICKDISIGKQIEFEIDVRRRKNASVSVERLIDMKKRCDDFKKSVERKRKMKMDYTLVNFDGHKRQKMDYASLIGNITTKATK